MNVWYVSMRISVKDIESERIFLYWCGCKAKVFAKEKGAMKKKIGAPDLMILFTGTVSHKMVNCAVEEAKKKSIPVCRCHTSSASALESILREYCA